MEQHILISNNLDDKNKLDRLFFNGYLIQSKNDVFTVEFSNINSYSKGMILLSLNIINNRFPIYDVYTPLTDSTILFNNFIKTEFEMIDDIENIDFYLGCISKLEYNNKLINILHYNDIDIHISKKTITFSFSSLLFFNKIINVSTDDHLLEKNQTKGGRINRQNLCLLIKDLKLFFNPKELIYYSSLLGKESIYEFGIKENHIFPNLI